MKRLNNKQNGMSGFGFGVVLVLITVATTIGLKLLPIYIEHFSVTSSLKALGSDEAGVEVGAIKSRLLSNFQINDVTNVGRQHIKIKSLGHNKKVVTIDYEVRRPVMGNVDVMVHFVDTVEISK